MKKTMLILLFALVTVSSFYSCSSDGLLGISHVKNTDFAAFETFNHFVGINNQTTFTLEGINGAITISPTLENYATISGEKKVQSESTEDANKYLEKLKVIIEDIGNDINVYTDQPDKTDGRVYTVSYNLKLPAHWEVNVVNVNGSVSIDSIENSVFVVVTNGNISLNSIKSSTVMAEVNNGDVTLNDINAPTNINLTNGNIYGNVILPADEFCVMNVANGTIGLQIPQNTNALFEADVTNGSVSVSALSLGNVTSSSTSVHGTLGTGNGKINLDVNNGAINVVGY